MRVPGTALSSILLLGILSACCAPDLDVDPALVLGTGEVEFESLGEEGVPVLPLIRGVQGGYHIWASLRATGLDWRNVRLDFTLSDEEGRPVDEPSRTQSEMNCCTEDGCEGLGEIVGFPVLVGEEPALVAGRTLTLLVEATDPDGRTASATRDLVPTR